ncbi:hypothetical protein [Streptomyces sp. NPDC058657]|uniref:hypothetical protein n=1 Tax=unclassified Streptomyces TaxID=2593676 RepID=UPI0036542F39
MHLFAGAGRTEEAVPVLQQHDRRNSHALAGYLVGLRRVEVLTVVLDGSPPRLHVLTTALWSDEPPF